MNKTLKKLIAIILLSSVVFFRTLPLGYAEELQAQPTLQPIQQPSQPSEPSTSPSPASQPSQPSTTPTQPSEPTGTPTTLQKAPELQAINPSPTPTPSTTQTNGTNSGAQANGQTGSTSVNTGNATSDTSISTNANSNVSAAPMGTTPIGSAVVNDGNGSNSVNNANSNSSSTTNTNQNNGAKVLNGINAATVTGGNSTSFNVGNSSIKTGDANVTGTAISTVNTNVDGVMVSEFNVADDHVGDLVLDFNKNCISGCADGRMIAANTNNGAGSTNNSSSNASNSARTTQNNNATVGSTLNLSADSGSNNASFNTNGDSNITTGNANVDANVLNFANNNISGNVVLGVVNIFGTLTGDIILTPEAMNAACGISCVNSGSATNANNGAGSTNTASTNSNNTTATFQNNDAAIGNNLTFDATTGNNNSSFNTNGGSTIKSGDGSVNSKVLNVANSNVDGGNVWLVLVNEAGKWLGRIVGAPEGSSINGSETLQFDVDGSGNVTATNADNGANSSNNASANESTNSTTTQNNNANIQNNLNLSANTGKNSTSYNTGGNSNIKTGDAKIVANIVNFVNNNIKSGGKLIVTVVNVFGKWIGDFVGPNQHKENKTSNTSQNVGGTNIVASNTVPTPTAMTVTPAPTKAVSFTRVTKKLVQGTATVNTNIIKNDQPKVTLLASANSSLYKDSYEGPATKNTIKINLAWFVIILPLAIVMYKSRMVIPALLRKVKK